MIGEIIFLLLILGAVLVVVLMTTIVQVEQYESGVALRLGKFHTTVSYTHLTLPTILLV